jgi:hypothetical protein
MKLNLRLACACMLSYTPSVPVYVAYNCLSKFNFVKFDKVLSKIYQLLQYYQINAITIIMKYTPSYYIY